VTITYTDQLREIERELRMRRQVYARQIAIGHMRAERAARKLELIAAVVETLRPLAEKELQECGL
jgi:hypothetical protein